MKRLRFGGTGQVNFELTFQYYQGMTTYNAELQKVEAANVSEVGWLRTQEVSLTFQDTTMYSAGIIDIFQKMGMFFHPWYVESCSKILAHRERKNRKKNTLRIVLVSACHSGLIDKICIFIMLCFLGLLAPSSSGGRVVVDLVVDRHLQKSFVDIIMKSH